MVNVSWRRIRQAVLAVIGLASLTCLVLGWHTRQPAPAFAGVMGALFLGTRRFRPAAPAPVIEAPAPAAPAVVRPERPPVDPRDRTAVIQQMLADGRYGILLRPAAARTLIAKQFDAALSGLEQGMALVPEGDVAVGAAPDLLDDARMASEPRVIHVAPVFLDRYPVTNRQYYDFVASGAYGQMPLWEDAIWPAVFDFVDRTGNPGPRHWIDGCYPAGKEDHPVVGISWFEADAYARWVGKRLPGGAEWVKAACWPVALGPGMPVERRYPWGNAMDRRRANLWGSGPGDTVAVSEFADGTSVGGVCQLIGNVWEWTAEAYQPDEHPSGDVSLPVPMKCIRGGAFDTYFDNQATCRFASGENPLGRKHNLGFRCALSLADVVLSPGDVAAAEQPAPEEAVA
jgi:iron(II)-dependent oxidoreductase